MGGPGSGNWYRYWSKSTTEGFLTLDINWLSQKKCLTPGRWNSVSWSRGEEETGSIGFRVEQTSLLLEYKIRPRGGDWEDVSDRVSLTSTPCNYGGQRPWFICPGCSRQVGKLYMGGNYFRCRRCYDLVYEVSREASHHRLLRKAQNIRRRLGGSASLSDLFPMKPKGMHWKTYLRLRQEAETAELGTWSAVAEKFGISV